MASKDNTFGFEDLQKAFNRIEKKYPNKTDAMLMSMARIAATRTKSKTPVGKTKKLKSTWRTKKPKVYGKVRVARMQSASRYAHVVEDGHEIVTGGKGSKNGRKLNTLQRAVRGVKSGGRVEGKKMVASAISEIESTFDKSAEKLLADLLKEVEL